MISERVRGGLLYLLAVLLTAAGGLWYFRFAPLNTSGPRVRHWRDDAANLLPDQPTQIRSDTIVMNGDSSTERNAPVGGGTFRLSMVCVGDQGRIRVRLSSSPRDDSGRAVPCSASPRTVSLDVALGDDFFMAVDAETGGGIAVFRWRLDRTRGA